MQDTSKNTESGTTSPQQYKSKSSRTTSTFRCCLNDVSSANDSLFLNYLTSSLNCLYNVSSTNNIIDEWINSWYIYMGEQLYM